MSKRSFAQTGFSKKDNRSMARTRRAVGVKKAPVVRNTSRMKAMLKSIEHKYKSDSVSNVAISKATTAIGWMNDPAAPISGIGIPAQGDDQVNRDGRQITVDQLEIKGVVTFAGAEDVINTPIGQVVFISLTLDKQTNKVQAQSEDIWTNPGGAKYTNPCPLRNPNDVNRYQTLRVLQITKPMVTLTQTAANTYSWPSCVVPWSMFVRFKKPIVVNFSNTSTPGIVDVMDNSFHINAVTGGNVDATLATADDCTLSYNARTRFYG